MINQIEKLRFPSDRHFTIEISLIMPTKQKKFIISLFISDNIKVKELKEFISKDFELPVSDMIFFNAFEGILQDSYEFQFEQDKKINLSLILNYQKKSASELNNINISKNEEIQKNINESKIIKKNEINKAVTQNKFLKIEDMNKEINNISSSKNEDLLFNGINCYNNGINNFINNKNEKINEKVKNDKFNFFSTKISEKKSDLNHSFLNMKRNLSPHQTKMSKYIIKNQNVEENNKNIKIINLNINKATNKSEVDKIN